MQSHLCSNPDLWNMADVIQNSHTGNSGADLGEGCRGCTAAPPPPPLRLSNTTGILSKKCALSMFISQLHHSLAVHPS